jgi:uncharacterized protein YceK
MFKRKSLIQYHIEDGEYNLWLQNDTGLKNTSGGPLDSTLIELIKNNTKHLMPRICPQDYILDGSTLVRNYNCETADIPAGVTVIGDYAFAGCEGLVDIILPAGITVIGNGAFMNCKNLTTINIPIGVTVIGNGAFTGCEGLVDITLPVGITVIGNATFGNCKNLAAIDIPVGVTVIRDSAFAGCENFMDITLPDSITTIGVSAFMGCVSLEVINIPAGVTVIGYGAFTYCENLKYITVEEKNQHFTDANGVLFDKIEKRILCYPAAKQDTCYAISAGTTIIGDYAFSGCKNLLAIDIPDSVTTIGFGAFFGCVNLITIDIPAGVAAIGNSVFSNGKNIDTIDITDRVRSMFDSISFWDENPMDIDIFNGIDAINDVFWDCRNLTRITVEKRNQYFADANGVLFDKIKNRIMCYPIGKQGTCYAIPAGITYIGDYAFSGCKNLLTIDIPDSVMRYTSILNHP